MNDSSLPVLETDIGVDIPVNDALMQSTAVDSPAPALFVPLNNFSVTEFLLLLIFIVLCADFVLKLFYGASCVLRCGGNFTASALGYYVHHERR